MADVVKKGKPRRKSLELTGTVVLTTELVAVLCVKASILGETIWMATDGKTSKLKPTQARTSKSTIGSAKRLTEAHCCGSVLASL